MRTAFLDHLAGSCNVRESAAAAGVAAVNIYELRRKDARFAAEWQEALLAGYQLLETELVGYALAGGNAAQDIAGATRRVDVDIAVKLLGLHRNALLGLRRPKPLTKRATSEETDRAILKKLDALDRARKRRDDSAAA
ncbi:hypothetical protein [Sphingomonas sp. LM7]|uniref:hypothetical protein n=1 Tax=Sphingomonas sp. LM7 TaxID=1938607 RepID=UPI0015C552B9|nr:hypothetical protein [Sphingomonas sp. LM7]